MDSTAPGPDSKPDPRSRLTLHFITFNIIGSGMSGGDRIFIESARRIAADGHQIHIWISEEGEAVCRHWQLNNVTYHTLPTRASNRWGFVPNIFLRTWRGWKMLQAEAEKLKSSGSKPASSTVVYSVSDFYPDSLPGYWFARALGAPWIGSCYLFAPNPFRGFESQWQWPKLNGMLYWLGQKPIVRLIHRHAATVFVTYDLDIPAFRRDHVEAIYGGVEFSRIQQLNFKSTEPSSNPANSNSPHPGPSPKSYEGVFVGRIHPQKGLSELCQAWAVVRAAKPQARLAFIGVGAPDWEQFLRQEIERHGLTDAVDLLGYVDGDAKYAILKSSRVFLCTNLYDSGGMATIEAMACGLPVVSFDFPATRSLLPHGTLRVPFRDGSAFGQTVLKLLDDASLHQQVSREALSLAAEWDWDARARRLLGFFEETLRRS